MTELNIPLLRKAVEWVEDEAQKPAVERQWDQSTWIVGYGCGTTYCVAGYVAMLGDERYGDSRLWVDVDGDGNEIHCSDFAQRELGISNAEAAELFFADNSAADVRRIAEQIAGGPL